MDDAEFLEFQEPAATSFFLSIIAQEEFAKAFLLLLVRDEIIPWNQKLLWAAKDHKCKQLLCLVMDYLNPEYDEFKVRCDAVVLYHQLPEFPSVIADAIHILRYEKIGRWVSKNWVWAEEPQWDREALAVAEGKRDRVKQDALYVRLGADCSVASTPKPITRDMYTIEQEKAARFKSLVSSMNAEKGYRGLDHEKVEEMFRVLFTSITDE